MPGSEQAGQYALLFRILGILWNVAPNFSAPSFFAPSPFLVNRLLIQPESFQALHTLQRTPPPGAFDRLWAGYSLSILKKFKHESENQYTY
jgi:hypothetical protein